MIKCSCLCKSVEFEVNFATSNYSVCHCKDCRKWTGGVFMSLSGGKDLNFKNEAEIGRYSHSSWAERGFSKKCGTNLFYRMKKSNHYFLMLGVIDDEITLNFDEQQFIDEKPNHFSFTNATKVISKKEMKIMLDDYLNIKN